MKCSPIAERRPSWELTLRPIDASNALAAWKTAKYARETAAS
jgi:hypothetical protein